MNNPIEHIRKIIFENECDGAIITNHSDIRYLSGLKSSNILILITLNSAYVLSDGRYKYLIERQNTFIPICITKNIFDSVIELSDNENIKKMLIDPSEISHKNYSVLNEKINLIHFEGLLEKIRIIKNEYEIENIMNAQKIADKAFFDTLEFITTGMTTKQIAAFLDYRMASYGSEEPAFSTITVNEEESADCHGVPSDKVIKKGDLLLFDFGATFNGYRSDITRTIAIGEISKEKEKYYNLVLEAHNEAVKILKPGIKCSDIDEVSRLCFKKENVEEYFIHSLGHGVGLDIHEAPYINKKSETILEKGMIVTIEPGLYFKNKFGIRIEDTYLITENGCKSLTNIQKNLIII